MKIMKTIFAVSLMAILVTGMVAPALQDAYAYPQKADNSEKLKVKSFGVKTKNKISFSDTDPKHNIFGTIKEQQVKTYKKIVAEYSAKQVLKNLYNLG